MRLGAGARALAGEAAAQARAALRRLRGDAGESAVEQVLHAFDG